jgi:hypothetical protein
MLAERLGRNVELTVKAGGEQVIVLASGREGVDEGGDITMTVADSDVHVFTAGDGDTVRLDTTDETSRTRGGLDTSRTRGGLDNMEAAQ